VDRIRANAVSAAAGQDEDRGFAAYDRLRQAAGQPKHSPGFGMMWVSARTMVKHSPAAKANAQPESSSDPADVAAVPPHDAPPPPLADATPSMAQYLEIKAANPDSLLWYRMGDFYELFFQDAVAASEALSIVLTKRGKHLGQDIAMCGVPVHRADEYLQRLIRKGFRVAVCEQLEDPAEARKRGAKAVVKRDVVRLVTPGTITEDALLDAKARNYLTSVFAAGATLDETARVALASVDISTGEFELGEVAAADLAGELVRLSPGEVVIADALLADAMIRRGIDLSGAVATPIPAAYFDSAAGTRDLKAQLGVKELDGFGSFTRLELAAVGGVLKYIALTQMGQRALLRPPRKTSGRAALTIDAASRSSLELVKSSSGDSASTLLSAMDRTVTGAGARELQGRLSSPLSDPVIINDRLDAVTFLLDRRRLLDDVRQALRRAPDIARAMPRLGFGRGGPRDLASIGDGLVAAENAAKLLRSAADVLGLPPVLEGIAQRLSAPPKALAVALANAIVDEPPHQRRDGGFVRKGYSTSLDEALALRDDSRSVLARLEARYVEDSGIKTLKVRHNNILGYFVEVTQLNAKPLQSPPLNDVFRHRQTMANAVRFSTAELLEAEGLIASASERALNLEQEIFADLVRQVAESENSVCEAASALADLDVIAALAALALEQSYVRPVVDDSDAFEIIAGRHPVVQQALARAQAGAFIGNDCVLGRAGSSPPPGFDELPDARIWLVTGPNMAGKSTFLRQNALITVMAQMGSYVPAKSATIGAVDRLFSRVGASDDLARGRSTFMVEMVETAAILNQATSKSLIILDEIGRGTATFDGLSIAWATVEYLHDVTKARALFATHYHELTALARKLAGVANVTMDITDWQDEIVFLHKVKPGAASRSYGIQVAKLAGLPQPVLTRAKQVLALLEKSDRRPKDNGGALDDLPLFAVARPQSGPPAKTESVVETALAAIRPDELTPKAALEKLYDLKALADTKRKKDA
jgi:DNA mismatch repair protein MutS